MTVIKTVGMSVGGAGVVGATGYGAYELIQPKTIGDQLKWNGKTLLDTEGDKDKEKWTKLVTKYPPADATKKLDELSNFSTSSTTNEAKEKELKSACKTALDTTLTNETTDKPKLDKAEAWCTHESANLQGT